MIKQLLNSIIAKYRDYSVSRRSIICLSLRLWQIIHLLTTGKPRYFTITGFENCFIILSPSFFLYLFHSLTAQGSHLPFLSQAWLKLCMSGQNITIHVSKTHLDDFPYDQTIICRRLYSQIM